MSRESKRGRGRSSGRGRGRGTSEGGRRGGKKDFPFDRIGSITASKDTEEEFGELIDDLVDSKAKFWCKVYLKKGADNIMLYNGDKLMISFNPHSKDPEFVLGKMYLPKDED